MAPKAGSFELSCPYPIQDYPIITLGHGGGGKLTQQLIDQIFRPVFGNASLEAQHDGATLQLPTGKVAFTTDSYVVQPLFFPGADIGKLAVTGTANDLAMCGARPLYLSCGFILEEGLSTEMLLRIVQSMKRSADEIGVQLVTGDTKVVERGKCDGIFINTAGIGAINHALNIAPSSVQPGDVIILSGDIGRHGIAVLSKREGLQFEVEIESDCAQLSPVVLDLLNEEVAVTCLRDLTRGGFATALVEIAEASAHTLKIQEVAVSVDEGVQGACEILGLDPFYVANEGRFIAFVAPADATRALAIMQRHEVSQAAVIVGDVAPGNSGRGLAVATTSLGVGRVLDRLSGEQLPRIC